MAASSTCHHVAHQPRYPPTLHRPCPPATHHPHARLPHKHSLRCISAITVNVFNEIPAVQTACGTAHLPPRFWGIAIGWSIAIFLVAEVRKWALFLWPKSLFARTFAW